MSLAMNNNNDDGMKLIPVMSRPAPVMEVGPNGTHLASMAASKHPVQELQSRRQQQHTQSVTAHLSEVRHLYGSGLAMILATEHQIAHQQEAIMKGLPATGTQGRLYGDIVTNRDVQLDFDDFLNVPEHRAVVDAVMNPLPHSVMERQLGMAL